jgi:hypothetical protein
VLPKDIAVNLKKLKLVALEAAQLPRSLQDSDYAFVNGNYALASGLKLTDALITEKFRPTTSIWWRCAVPTRTSPMRATSPLPTARAPSSITPTSICKAMPRPSTS